MSILTEHPINGVIDNLLVLSDDERVTKLESALPPDLQAGLGRVFNFARLLRDLIEKSAPEEVSLSGLNGVNSNLQQAYSEFSAFIASGNQANLTNALSALDNAANIFAWTFYSRPIKGAKPQFEAVDSVRKAAEKAISSITKQTSDFQNLIASGNSQLRSQDERIEQLTATLDEVRNSSTAAVAAIQQQFSENLSAYRSELDDLKTKFRSTQEQFSAEATQKATSLINELEFQRDQAAQIVQIVGNIGVTGNYQNRATSEQKQANVWRLVTIVLFGLGVLLVTANLILNLSSSIDLKTLVIRFAIAVAVTIPAIYTARESARHRSNSDRAKQTELELASLSPFLENLPDEQRDEIIGDLAKTYFGQRVEDHKIEAPVDVNRLMESFATIAAKIKSPS